MMKRILALLLSILLITGSMVTPVFAAEAGGSITVSPATVHPGETFTATLKSFELGQVTALQVKFDCPNGLLIDKDNTKWENTDKAVVNHIDYGTNKGVLAYGTGEYMQDTRSIFSVVYQVSPDFEAEYDKATAVQLHMTLQYTDVEGNINSVEAYGSINVTKECGHPKDMQVQKDGKPATCTEPGKNDDIWCNQCQTMVKEGASISKKGHKDSPSWEHDEEYHWKKCLNSCGEPQKKAEHDWKQVVEPSTETKPGKQYDKCETCGATRNIIDLSPQTHEHSMTHHPRNPATCTATGTKEYWECSKPECEGKYYGDIKGQTTLTEIIEPVNENNHLPGTERENQKEATCGENGHTGVLKCTLCDTVTDSGQIILANGPHTPGKDWEHDNEHHWKICSVCEKELEKAKHDFEVVPDTPATEAEPGIGHEKCTVCGKTGKQNLTIDKLEHRHTGIVKHNAVAATCTEPGNVTYWTCSGDLCKDKFYGDSQCANELPSVETRVNPDNHTGGTTVKNKKDATCTEKGYTGDKYCNSCEEMIEPGTDIQEKGHIGGTATCKEKAVCTRCKKSYGELNSNNHTGGTEIKNKKDATCGAAGYTGDTWCKGCNTMTQKGKEIAATGRHTAGAEWKTDSTNHWHICSVCNAQVDKAAHNFQWTTDKEPTEDATGLKHEECHICHMKRNEGTVIEKLDHKHTGITRHTAVAATCIKEGNVEYWTCSSSKCSGKYYGDANCTTILTTIKTSVNSANHTGGTEIKNKKDATCYAEGYTGDSCCVSCGAVITTGQTIPATGKHNAGAEWRYDSTNHWHICTNSGCSQKVDVTSHTYTWVVDKAATEDSVGAKHEECVCGSKRSEGTEIPKLDHKHSGITHHKAVPATCVATGTVEYWTCSHTKCAGKYYGDAACQILLKTINEPVNKNNHTGGTEIKNKKAATCGEAGYTGDIYCTSCKNVREQGEMIPATGKHTPKTGYQKDAEFHWQLCSVCNAVMDGVKEEHTYTWIVDKEASETAAGKKHQECTVCGHKSNENTVIEKLPHDLKFVAAKSCTCTEDGCVEHFHCAGCGKYYLSENGKVGKETTAQGVLVPASGHTGDGVWFSDETSHWHKCGCGEAYDAEDHKTEIIGAVEPTETAEGYSGDTVCQICGIVVAEGEALPVVIPETTPATEPEPEVTEPASEVTEPETAEPESAKKTAVSPVVIVAAAAVAVAGAAGGAVIFLRKRKF